MAKKDRVGRNHGIENMDVTQTNDNLSTAVTYIAVCNDIKEQKMYGEYSSDSSVMGIVEKGASNSGVRVIASVGLVFAFTFFAVIVCISASGYFDAESFGDRSVPTSSSLAGTESLFSVPSDTVAVSSEVDVTEETDEDDDGRSMTADIAFEEMASIFGASMSNVTDYCSKIYRVPSGVILNGISSGAAADRCGLNSGDIIVACGSSNVTDIESLYYCLISSAKNESAISCGDGELPIEYYVYGVPVKTSLYVFRNGKFVILEGEFDVSLVG